MMGAIQSRPAAHRASFFFKMLTAFWNEIGQAAAVAKPIELIDIIRPTRERVISILSGYINYDIFIANMAKDSSIESFDDILMETKDADDHFQQFQKRIAELERVVAEKTMKNAENAETLLQLKFEADRIANELQSDKEMLENLKTSCDEKIDEIQLLNVKIEECERKEGSLQSEIDRISEFHVPDINSFINEPKLLEQQLDDLKKQAANAANKQNRDRELINLYAHLHEELATCFALVEQSYKFGKEVEDVAAQLVTTEEAVAQVRNQLIRKQEEYGHLKTTVEQQMQKRQRRPQSPTFGSQNQGSQRMTELTAEDEMEIKGRMEESEALTQLLMSRERYRTGIFSVQRELDNRHNLLRDRLAENVSCFRMTLFNQFHPVPIHFSMINFSIVSTA